VGLQKPQTSDLICLRKIICSSFFEGFYFTHALINGGASSGELLHTHPTRHAERHEAGDEAWRATKALLFGGGFLQGVENQNLGPHRLFALAAL